MKNTKTMPETVSKLTSALIAQGLADRYPNSIQVFRQGMDYYTYTDISVAAGLTGADYTNVNIPQTTIDGTLPVAPIRKMFPR